MNLVAKNMECGAAVHLNGQNQVPYSFKSFVWPGNWARFLLNLHLATFVFIK